MSLRVICWTPDNHSFGQKHSTFSTSGVERNAARGRWRGDGGPWKGWCGDGETKPPETPATPGATRRGTIGRGHDQVAAPLASAFTWADHEGLHALVPGEPPAPELLQELTRVVHENMRHAPEWAEIVAQLGPDEAARLLQ